MTTRRNHGQLEFTFSDGAQRLGADVIPFPLARRRKKVMDVARQILARKTEAGRANYWNRLTSSLAAELRKRGLGAAEIDRELWAFYAAVDNQICRGDEQRPSGGRA